LETAADADKEELSCATMNHQNIVGYHDEPEIFDVTAGFNSKHTKQAYRLAFNHFLKVTVQNDNLRALLDAKPSVIESKIIKHLIYLKDVRKLSYWTIQVHCSAMLRFFSMNDVNNLDRVVGNPDKEQMSHRISLVFWH
jgi:hypothetical protein